MVQSIHVVLLVEDNNGDASLDGTELGNNALSRVGLVGVKDKLVTGPKASLEESKSES